jgi:hypothetical protein
MVVNACNFDPVAICPGPCEFSSEENTCIPNYVSSTGLTGWWPFNGNAQDESGNGNHGVVNGAQLTSNRNSEQSRAYYFDGDGDFIKTVSGFYDPSIDHTVSIWYELADPGDVTNTLFNTSIHRFEAIGFNTYFLPGENKFSYCLGDGVNWPMCGSDFGFEVDSSVDFNSWNLMTVVKEYDTYRFYSNGILVHSQENVDFMSANSMDLWFGAISGGYGPPNEEYFGKLDDIGVWNRALTAEEVMALYLAAPLSAGCTDPAACNFNPEANYDDGSCIESGCTDPAACNFNPEAGCDDGSCAPADAVPGCMEAAACNYDAAAVCAAPCVYPPAGSADCGAGAAFCGEGMVWDAAAQTCVIHPDYLTWVQASAAQSACGPWTVWDAATGQCVGTLSSDCPADVNGNGFVGVEDLLQLLSEFATDCP